IIETKTDAKIRKSGKISKKKGKEETEKLMTGEEEMEETEEIITQEEEEKKKIIKKKPKTVSTEETSVLIEEKPEENIIQDQEKPKMTKKRVKTDEGLKSESMLELMPEQIVENIEEMKGEDIEQPAMTTELMETKSKIKIQKKKIKKETLIETKSKMKILKKKPKNEEQAGDEKIIVDVKETVESEEIPTLEEELKPELKPIEKTEDITEVEKPKRIKKKTSLKIEDSPVQTTAPIKEAKVGDQVEIKSEPEEIKLVVDQPEVESILPEIKSDKIKITKKKEKREEKPTEKIIEDNKVEPVVEEYEEVKIDESERRSSTHSMDFKDVSDLNIPDSMIVKSKPIVEEVKDIRIVPIKREQEIVISEESTLIKDEIVKPEVQSDIKIEMKPTEETKTPVNVDDKANSKVMIKKKKPKILEEEETSELPLTDRIIKKMEKTDSIEEFDESMRRMIKMRLDKKMDEMRREGKEGEDLDELYKQYQGTIEEEEYEKIKKKIKKKPKETPLSSEAQIESVIESRPEVTEMKETKTKMKIGKSAKISEEKEEREKLMTGGEEKEETEEIITQEEEEKKKVVKKKPEKQEENIIKDEPEKPIIEKKVETDEVVKTESMINIMPKKVVEEIKEMKVVEEIKQPVMTTSEIETKPKMTIQKKTVKKGEEQVGVEEKIIVGVKETVESQEIPTIEELKSEEIINQEEPKKKIILKKPRTSVTEDIPVLLDEKRESIKPKPESESIVSIKPEIVKESMQEKEIPQTDALLQTESTVKFKPKEMLVSEVIPIIETEMEESKTKIKSKKAGKINDEKVKEEREKIMTVQVIEDVVVEEKEKEEEPQKAIFKLGRKKSDQKVEPAEYSIDSKTKSIEEQDTEITIKKIKKKPSITQEESVSQSIRMKSEEKVQPSLDTVEVAQDIAIKKQPLEDESQEIKLKFRKKSIEEKEEKVELTIPKKPTEEPE
ncbi:unnamed protein product, partial [Sphagnum balticum]